MKKKLEILYEDNDLVFVNKPANLLCIPDRYEPEKPNLYHILQRKYSAIFIVHRIDKETSGVVCFAKTPTAHQAVSKQFENREIDKTYQALVEGVVYPRTNTINVPIANHPAKNGKMVIHKNGKPALSHYETLEHFEKYTLLSVKIETGRTHQIRVHLAHIGFPLAIDKLYGRETAFYLSKIKRKYNIGKFEEEKPLMNRLTLHAYTLAITHPITSEKIQVQAPLPKDFKAVIKQLSKWGKA